MTPLIVAPSAAAILSAAALFALLRAPGLLLDRPNERSLHERPVPRTGGIAIVAGTSMSAAALIPDSAFLLMLALSVSLVSLLDDWRGLATLPRLAVHTAAAAIFVRYGLDPVSVLESAIITFAIVWMCNLFNFMDGSDGLAGGMAIIGFAAYALAAWLAGDVPLAAWSAALAAASLPFLWFNFHPARVFMGDAGSVTLGFLAAALGAAGWRNGAWPALFPVLVFSPFIMDASLTLLKRFFAGERFWRPHRDHYYQKLVRMGLGHRKTALYEYLLMLMSSACALGLIGTETGWQTAVTAGWIAVIVVLALLVERSWYRHAAESESR